MKSIRTTLFATALICATTYAFAEAAAAVAAPEAPKPTYVACLGDSITFGAGTQNARTDSYPMQMLAILGGANWAVTNFGVSGRTLSRDTEPLDYSKALASNPDVVVIMLGTNDTKPNNWDKCRGSFLSDYTNMVAQFQALPSKPRVFVCLPPPAFPGNWGIRNNVIRYEVCPRVRKVGELTGAKVIDVYGPMLSERDLFPDTVHPNNDGARKIAEIVAEAIRPAGE